MYTTLSQPALPTFFNNNDNNINTNNSDKLVFKLSDLMSIFHFEKLYKNSDSIIYIILIIKLPRNSEAHCWWVSFLHDMLVLQCIILHQKVFA